MSYNNGGNRRGNRGGYYQHDNRSGRQNDRNDRPYYDEPRHHSSDGSFYRNRNYNNKNNNNNNSNYNSNYSGNYGGKRGFYDNDRGDEPDFKRRKISHDSQGSQASHHHEQHHHHHHHHSHHGHNRSHGSGYGHHSHGGGHHNHNNNGGYRGGRRRGYNNRNNNNNNNNNGGSGYFRAHSQTDHSRFHPSHKPATSAYKIGLPDEPQDTTYCESDNIHDILTKNGIFSECRAASSFLTTTDEDLTEIISKTKGEATDKWGISNLDSLKRFCVLPLATPAEDKDMTTTRDVLHFAKDFSKMSELMGGMKLSKRGYFVPNGSPYLLVILKMYALLIPCNDKENNNGVLTLSDQLQDGLNKIFGNNKAVLCGRMCQLTRKEEENGENEKKNEMGDKNENENEKEKGKDSEMKQDVDIENNENDKDKDKDKDKSHSAASKREEENEKGKDGITMVFMLEDCILMNDEFLLNQLSFEEREKKLMQLAPKLNKHFGASLHKVIAEKEEKEARRRSSSHHGYHGHHGHHQRHYNNNNNYGDNHRHNDKDNDNDESKTVRVNEFRFETPFRLSEKGVESFLNLSKAVQGSQKTKGETKREMKQMLIYGGLCESEGNEKLIIKDESKDKNEEEEEDIDITENDKITKESLGLWKKYNISIDDLLYGRLFYNDENRKDEFLTILFDTSYDTVEKHDTIKTAADLEGTAKDKCHENENENDNEMTQDNEEKTENSNDNDNSKESNTNENENATETKTDDKTTEAAKNDARYKDIISKYPCLESGKIHYVRPCFGTGIRNYDHELFTMKIDRLYVINGLARSGNHVFISWLLTGLSRIYDDNSIIYINNIKTFELNSEEYISRKFYVESKGSEKFDPNIGKKLVHSKDDIHEMIYVNKECKCLIISTENKTKERLHKYFRLFRNCNQKYCVMIIRDILNLFSSRIESEKRVLMKDGRHEREKKKSKDSNYWVTDECTILYWLDNVKSCDMPKNQMITFNFDKFNGFVNQKLDLTKKLSNEDEWDDEDIVQKLTNEKRLEYIENLKNELDLKFDDDDEATNDKEKEKEKEKESGTATEGESEEIKPDFAVDSPVRSSIKDRNGNNYGVSVGSGTILPKNKFGLTAGSSFGNKDSLRGTYFTRFRKYIELKHPLMKQILCDEKYKDKIKESLKKYFDIELVGDNPFEKENNEKKEKEKESDNDKKDKNDENDENEQNKSEKTKDNEKQDIDIDNENK